MIKYGPKYARIYNGNSFGLFESLVSFLLGFFESKRGSKTPLSSVCSKSYFIIPIPALMPS